MTETIAGIPLVRALPGDLQLAHGKHDSPEAGMCIMEAVVFLTGEQWSDAPMCVSPVIRRFAIGLNDRWSDAERQQLVPFIRKVIGTTRTTADELTRRYLALDWAYRVAVPAALDYGKLGALAARLRALEPVTNSATADAGYRAMNAIYEETRERREAARARLRKEISVAAAAVAAVAEVAEVVAEAAAAAVAAVAEVAEVVAEAAAVAEAAVAEVAEVVAEAAAVAEAAEAAVVAAVVEISRALAGEASSGSWAQPIADIIKAELAKLPKNPVYMTVHNAIYWPVRRKMAEILASGALGGDYLAYRRAMQASALDLLDRMIAVGQEVAV